VYRLSPPIHPERGAVLSPVVATGEKRQSEVSMYRPSLDGTATDTDDEPDTVRENSLINIGIGSIRQSLAAVGNGRFSPVLLVLPGLDTSWKPVNSF
jgi:hypothetical protein